MRFRFRLTRLLELRDAEVERAERKLGAAIQATRSAEADMIAVQRSQKELDASWSLAMKSAITGQVMMDFNNQRLKLMCDHAETEEKLLKARQHEQTSKRELERALAKQKSLQKLQLRARMKHEAEERRVEQAQLDEFGTTSIARKD